MKALQMFGRYGLKPVTMDDIAREMSVSKKTLYRYYDSKEALIRAALHQIFTEISGQMLSLGHAGGNAIDQLFAADEQVCATIENHDPGLQFQLQRYYPELHAEMEEKRKELIYKMVDQNIRQGKTEGLYRAELDVELMSLLYYGRTLLFTEQTADFIEQRSLPRVMRQILVYHIRGMATAEGLRYLESKEKLNDKVSPL